MSQEDDNPQDSINTLSANLQSFEFSHNKKKHFSEDQEELKIEEEGLKGSPSKDKDKKEKASSFNISRLIALSEKLEPRVTDLETNLEQQKTMLSIVSDIDAVIMAKGQLTEDTFLLVQQAIQKNNAFLAVIMSAISCLPPTLKEKMIGEYLKEEMNRLSKELYSTKLRKRLTGIETNIEHLSQELNKMKLGAEVAINQEVTAFNSQETSEIKMEVENLEKNPNQENQRVRNSQMRGHYPKKKVKLLSCFMFALFFCQEIPQSKPKKEQEDSEIETNAQKQVN